MKEETKVVLESASTENTISDTEESRIESATKNAEKRCPKCQALLTEEQVFCPECGTSFKKFCPNCRTELQEGQAFCPSCGWKVEENHADLSSSIVQFNQEIQKQKGKNKILPILLGILAVCGIAVYLLVTIFLNPQHYIEKGDYQTAYKVANAESKEYVLRENIIAVVSSDCVDSLKDSASFELREAYISFKDSSKGIVLKVAANNSYGNQVINYWYYTYDKDDAEYSLYTSFSDFDEEKTYSWDNSSERIEKLLKNLAKTTAKTIISNGYKIKDESVDNINQLFENDILDDVRLLDVEPQKTE